MCLSGRGEREKSWEEETAKCPNGEQQKKLTKTGGQNLDSKDQRKNRAKSFKSQRERGKKDCKPIIGWFVQQKKNGDPVNEGCNNPGRRCWGQAIKDQAGNPHSGRGWAGKGQKPARGGGRNRAICGRRDLPKNEHVAPWGRGGKNSPSSADKQKLPNRAGFSRKKGKDLVVIGGGQQGKVERTNRGCCNWSERGKGRENKTGTTGTGKGGRAGVVN